MKKHAYYSHTFMAMAMIVSFGACTKEISQPPAAEPSAQSPILKKGVSNSTPTHVELAMLYAKRVFTFPFDLNPSDDPDGSMQAMDQPFTSGIYLLGGGNAVPKSHSYREITIPAGYTHVFAPLAIVLAWLNECDPGFYPAPGQSVEDFMPGIIMPYLDRPVTLECRLNKKSQIRGNFQTYRVTTPVFNSLIHPSWGLGYGTCGSDGEPFLGALFVDGYYVLIPIPDKDFTLEIGGGSNANHSGIKGGVFRNDVTYTVKR